MGGPNCIVSTYCVFHTNILKQSISRKKKATQRINSQKLNNFLVEFFLFCYLFYIAKVSYQRQKRFKFYLNIV